jgi:regulator of RNase E activity RraA
MSISDSTAEEQLLSTIRRNRISSVEIADAQSKTGVQEGLSALNAGHYAAGQIEYVFTHSESNWPLHKQIESVREDTILYVDAIGCGDRAVLGDIVSKYLFVYRRISALVINGLVRDAHRLRKENYPIWVRGVTPLGCFNKDVPVTAEIDRVATERRELFQGSILVCDDSGCTLIQRNNLTAEMNKKLEFIELQEDIWYFCTDTLKWSTYETICLKKYLEQKDVLPESLIERLREFEL